MFAKFFGWWRWRGKRDEADGQGLVEYALILVLVSIVVITVLSFLGGSIRDTFQEVADALQGQQVSILEAVYFPNSNKIDIRAHYRDGYDPNVTLMISRDGGAPAAMSLWSTWPGSNSGLAPTYGRSYANANTLGCPCTFTITDPDGKTKTVTVSTD